MAMKNRISMGVQEQAIRANAIKAKTDKTQAKSKCRLCGKVDETVRYIICECPMWMPYHEDVKKIIAILQSNQIL